jgi:AcrR family transcriptional regulator
MFPDTPRLLYRHTVTQRTAARKGRRYAGMPPGARLAARRERLLDAGLELFATRGYGATSIGALCRAAKVAPRSFYEAFPGREALLAALLDRLAREQLEAVADAIASRPPDDVEARARAGLEAFAHVLTGDERKARVQLVEAVGVSPALERRRRQAIHAFADLVAAEVIRLARARAIPPRPDGDVALAALALVGAAGELLVDWVHAPAAARPPVERLVGECVRLFVASAGAGRA